mmetsp:Transcript_95680/g.143314  ORF Transcript_95680/g.143314 Transcript_95680/m.143314 type:complete len:200 (+) Transcript_95680:687-1286(+)
MSLGFCLINSLLGHEEAVIVYTQRQWHPEMRIGIQLGNFGRQFLAVFLQHGREDLSRYGETSQGRTDLPDSSQLFQHFGGGGVIHLFDLGGFRDAALGALQDRNDTILVQSLGGPLFCGRCGIAQQGAHDIDVVSGSVFEVDAGQKDLVSPKDAQPSLAGRGVNSRLLDDGFQDGQGVAIACFQKWQFHSRLVVILPRR